MTTGRATRAAAVGERILADGVIAIFRGVPPDGVLGLAADLAGGVRVLEVPLTEPAALESIAALREALHGRAVVGAGSVRTAEDVRGATGAGAEFVVSAGFFDAVAEACLAEDLLYPPGMLSASEVGRALVDGFDLLKLFPAGPVGPRWLAALLGPYPDAKFIAVGNLDEQGAARRAGRRRRRGLARLRSPRAARPELARLVDRLRARHGAKLSSSS